MSNATDKISYRRFAAPIRLGLSGALLGAALLLASCSLVGGSTERLERSDDYKLAPLPQWKKISRNESDAAYQTSTGAVVTVVSSCRRTTTDLRALTRQLVIGMRKVNWVEQKDFKGQATQGLLSRVHGTFEGTPVHMLLYVTRNKNCVMDFSMMQGGEISTASSDEFLKFIGGVRFDESKD